MLTVPFTVHRSLVMDAPADRVCGAVADFNTWSSWSPWLSQEPECPG